MVLAALIALVVAVPGVPAVLPGIGQLGGALGGTLGVGLGVVLSKVFLFALVFYVILVRRQVSRRTRQLGRELAQEHLDPSGYFSKVADRSHGMRVPAIVALASVAALAIVLIILEPPWNGTYVWYELPVYVTLTFLRWIVYAACVYTFAVIAWGMYQYAERPFAVVSLYEDPALGLGPLGALTVALAGYYTAFLALLTLYASVSGNGPLTFGIAGTLAAIGAAMFYLPLRTVHTRMVAEKESALRYVRRRMHQEVQALDFDHPESGAANAASLLALSVMEQRVDAMRTWPFGTGALEAMVGRMVIPIGLAIAAGLLLHYAFGA